jgi:hypothetical protein
MRFDNYPRKPEKIRPFLAQPTLFALKTHSPEILAGRGAAEDVPSWQTFPRRGKILELVATHTRCLNYLGKIS